MRPQNATKAPRQAPRRRHFDHDSTTPDDTAHTFGHVQGGVLRSSRRAAYSRRLSKERRVSHEEVFPVPPGWAERAHLDAAAYEAACRRVEADPEGYWRELASRLDWIKFPSQIKDVSFAKDDFRIRWYADGVLNASANCLDRHLPERANDTAIIFEGDDPGHSFKVTYAELHAEVCRLANVL